MRVDNLHGAQLDYFVALAEGLDATLIHANGMDYCRIDVQHQGESVYVPTHNWTLLGEILKRQRYLLYPRAAEPGSQEVVWLAEAQLNSSFNGMYADASPELAICRLRVAEAFGEEVSV
ncbi:phage protein NinX family protein [Caballeronia sp. dw_19]|uniref:phage protein NinX family protein n=1 Tax=Caballeronia sp. dw_19 TaxID=2719791 RepID=UPI001BCB10EB|nr:phage protein NinX family protein [Caballeronia sp. dw_19]